MTLQKPADQLDLADARCIALLECPNCLTFNRYSMGSFAKAAGFASSAEHAKVWFGSHPLVSRKKMPGDAIPRRLFSLLLELIQTEKLPNVLRVAVSCMLGISSMFGRPAVAASALASGACHIVLSELNKLGTPKVSVLGASQCACFLPLG